MSCPLYDKYDYTFSITIKDELDNVDTANINFKANDLKCAITQIESFINTFLNSAGYAWYDKNRILLTSISDDEETYLLDILNSFRINEEVGICGTIERKGYLKLELFHSPCHSSFPAYNNAVIEKEFTITQFCPFEYHIGKCLNALLNYHCNEFTNYTVFPYSITDEEKELLLHELESYRKENNEGCEQYKQL